MKNRFLWGSIALILAITATTIALSYMVTDPAHMINELGGDCGKNYYTFLWHSVYGKGFWFDGMNYPFGEHIIYADGQPFLSTALHWLHPDAHTALAVMNLAIALSYVIAMLFTYLVLTRMGVRPPLAAVFACLISLLSPQVLRVHAHFGLSYLFPVPALFYFSLMYRETGRLKWAIFIFLLGAVMSFVHLYLGGLVFVWVLAYCFGSVICSRAAWRRRFSEIIPLLLAVACLFGWIKLFIALTDPVKDRPSFPLNKLDTVTHIRDLVTSPYSPLWQKVMAVCRFSHISDAGEGFAYVGLAGIVIVFVWVVSTIVRWLRGVTAPALPATFSAVWLVVGISALLLAMGAPFIWHMRWLLDYMSIFKQFRAMGRFSWIFYQVFAVFAVVLLDGFLRRCAAAGRAWAGYSAVAAVALLWGAEVAGNVAYLRSFFGAGRAISDGFFQTGEMKWPELLAKNHYKAGDFQAIILLPFFESGSEKLWVGGDPSWPLSIGMVAAMELHLPIEDAEMSRTSWSQTEAQVKFAAGRYAGKPVLRDLKNDKPFLMICYDGARLTRDEEYLLQASDYIDNRYQADIFACYPGRLRALYNKVEDTISAIVPAMKGIDTCVRCTGPWLVDHFDGQSREKAFFGSGGCKAIAGDDTTVLNAPLHVDGDSVLYEFSGWLLLDDKDYRSPYLQLIQLDSAGRQLSMVNAPTNISVDNEGMWFRTAAYAYIRGNTRRIKIILCNEPRPAYLAFDELLVCPADAMIVSHDSSGKVLVNNHLLHQKF